MNLTNFLLARIADDEAYARNAFGDHNDVRPEWSEIWSGTVEIGGNPTDGNELLSTNDSQVSRHIERWDPARVLAECEAKWRIVELAKGPIYRVCEQVASEWGTHEDTYADENLLRLLALPYAQHPDYREEWRP